MSLILEALRRSEAERRRAAPPSLLGDIAPPRGPSSSPWPMALAGLAAGLLLAATAWWWGSARDIGPAETTRALAAPALAATEQAAPLVVEPVPPAAYAPPPTASMPIAAPQPTRTAPPPSPPAPAPAAPPRPSPDTSTPAAVDASIGPREGDLRWSDVAGEGMPALRVSMHVYADDPSRRFAIIDGQRRREGETLQPGLTLLEIRRDGLRLGWQGRVLWIPR